MPLKPLHDYLTAEDKRELDNVRECARRILERPVDLAYTDHTIAHKDIVVHHLDSFLRPWLDERTRLVGERLVRTEVMVLLCATYLHDIGMQMVHPHILAALPSFTDEERAEAARLSLANVTEDHRLFARRHHHRIGFDWITGSQGDIPGLPRLNGIDGFRLMVAKVARAHNIWLTDPESYNLYTTHVEPEEEPDGTVRLDLLAAFLRLADILDQDKRRVDLEAMKRLPVSPVSKVHWWRHHYVNACRIDTPTSHNFPLKVAFRLPKAYETGHDWLKEALYSATVKEVEAETIRLRNWLGECGINVVIPPQSECRFTIDPDAVPMPPEVLEAFSKTWRRAAGSSERANLRDATAKGELTANALADALLVALPRLAASVEIDEYITNTRRNLDGEFRDTPYSPLELRVDNQPELRSALDHLERQLQAPQVRPHPILVIGVPGGGKTMLLRRYVWEWSGRTRAETPLPLYIQATRFGTADWAKDVERRLGTTEAPCSDAEFRSIILESLDRFETLLAQSLCELAGLKASHEGEMRGALVALLARTPLAVFFDGINELPPMLYQLANHAVHAFLRTYRGHRVVVTSRTGDFRPGDFPDRVTCELAVMTEEAVTDYWAKAGVSSSAIRYFLEKASSGVREMVRTPMAAYMTGELLKKPDRQEAIDNQGRLFQQYVRETLRQWSARKEARSLSIDQAQDLLAEIAFHAFQNEQVAFSPALASTVIRDWFLKLEPEDAALLNPNGEGLDAVFARLSRELLSTSFLREVGDLDEPSLRFRHHTLQDYFAATAIATRWEELPTIVAQPVFHEAVSLLADVVDDPAQFIDRLTNATSNQWGFVHLLPLLFRVIGSSRLPVPQRVKLRVYAATLPLYSAAVALLSPFAAEVLCHLFAMVDWTVLGAFLAFIADERNTRPEWERELARVDVIKVMNQERTPSEDTLRPFFAARIPEELRHDYELAKTILIKRIDNRNEDAIFHKAPLLLGGLVSSISLEPKFKNHVANSISRLGVNQIGALQSVFLDEISSWGARLTAKSSLCEAFPDTIRAIYDFIFFDSDIFAINGDMDHYYSISQSICIKEPFIQRIILNSKNMPNDKIEELISTIKNFTPSGKLAFVRKISIIQRRSVLFQVSIDENVERAIRERMNTSNDAFLVSWMYEILNEVISNEKWISLESSLIAANAAGYWLSIVLKQPIPAALTRYAVPMPTLQVSDAIKRLMVGDASGIQQIIASIGLNKHAIEPLLSSVENTEQLIAIANCVYDFDRFFGRSAQIQALCSARTAKDVDLLMSSMNLTPYDVATSDDPAEGDLSFVISHLAKDHMPFSFRNTTVRLKWLMARGNNKKSFQLILSHVNLAERHIFSGDFYEPLKIALDIINQESHEGEQKKLTLSLFKSIASRIKWGQLVEWLIPFAHGKVKSGALPAEIVSTALVSALNEATPDLSRPERRRLFNLLQEIDGAAIARCFDVYLDACPVGGEATGNHLGSGAWAFYEAGDDARLLDLTERALVFAPQADWLLGNRAFALLLLGRSETEVLDAYRQTLACTPDRERWHRVAVEDLQLHGERRPQAPPIATPFIDKIVALGQSLPAAPPDPLQVPA